MATVNVWCDRFLELESEPDEIWTIAEALEKGGVTVNIRCEEPETLQWLAKLKAAQRQSTLSRWRLPALAGFSLLSWLAIGVFVWTAS